MEKKRYEAEAQKMIDILYGRDADRDAVINRHALAGEYLRGESKIPSVVIVVVPMMIESVQQYSLFNDGDAKMISLFDQWVDEVTWGNCDDVLHVSDPNPRFHDRINEKIVRMRLNGIHYDLVVVDDPRAFGVAMVLSTGERHVSSMFEKLVWMRRMGIDNNLLIHDHVIHSWGCEFGRDCYQVKDVPDISSFFELVGLDYIAPKDWKPGNIRSAVKKALGFSKKARLEAVL